MEQVADVLDPRCKQADQRRRPPARGGPTIRWTLLLLASVSSLVGPPLAGGLRRWSACLRPAPLVGLSAACAAGRPVCGLRRWSACLRPAPLVGLSAACAAGPLASAQLSYPTWKSIVA